MKKKIHICDVQTYESYEDKHHHQVEAVIGQKDQSFYISFKQIDPSQNSVIQTLIKIKKGVVTVKRSGAVRSILVFDITKDYQTPYYTPYGTFDLKIETHHIENRCSENHVDLSLHYDLYLNGQKASTNRYSITTV